MRPHNIYIYIYLYYNNNSHIILYLRYCHILLCIIYAPQYHNILYFTVNRTGIYVKPVTAHTGGGTYAFSLNVYFYFDSSACIVPTSCCAAQRTGNLRRSGIQPNTVRILLLLLQQRIFNLRMTKLKYRSSDFYFQRYKATAGICAVRESVV